MLLFYCSFGLTGITVIIKGLSSGFYQPSTGSNWVPLVRYVAIKFMYVQSSYIASY